jgi:hypothetical protein
LQALSGGAGGGGRRRSSPAIRNLGSGTRFEARIASMCGARAGEARRGDGCGGVAVERVYGAAARLG